MGRETMIAHQGLEDYFFHQVRRVFSNQKVDANPHTEFYLVRLLSDYSHHSALHSSKDEDTPLAILFLESLKAGQPEGFRLLKQLGDLCLFLSGFFQGSLQSKNIDLDYYINLGGNAYHRLHHMILSSKSGDTFRETFLELAAKFTRFMDVLSEISEGTEISKDSDLLKLYEKWLSTGSTRLLKKLNESGIYPAEGNSASVKH